MLPKYTIEYTSRVGKQVQANHYSTDDPVTCEEAIEKMLEGGFRISAIKHEGLDLPKQDFDALVKTAGGMLASKKICVSLGIKPDEAHYRFGFSPGDCRV